MDERNHLELRQIAEQASVRIRQVTDSLSELRANYDGPAIADNISEIEIVYHEIVELQNEEQREQRERSFGTDTRALWSGATSPKPTTDHGRLCESRSRDLSL